MAVTKPAGTWTYDDLFSLPNDGRRYEIIKGKLYEMPSPSLDHAATVYNLVLLLAPLIRSLGGRMFFAPLDVFFSGADPVQPDILIILPGWQGTLTQRGAEGAPDLMIEVLSPSNRRHDLLTKRDLYRHAGVREYWIVDPTQQTVEVFGLDRDALHRREAESGTGEVRSPLLSASFPLTAIFAGVGEIDV